MAMINYADKVALNQNSNIADINKVKADDMNELKRAFNDQVAQGWYKTGISPTFTYSSWDSTTYTGVINSNLDLTPYLSVGMKVKFTQSSTIKYAFITAITSTQLTLFLGTDYSLNNSAISNSYYSMLKTPYGFPMNPDKWSVSFTGTKNLATANPVNGTIYNQTSDVVNLPIGVWEIKYKCSPSGYIANGTSIYSIYSWSTSKTAETLPESTFVLVSEGPTGLKSNASTFDCNISKPIVLTTKTPYYFIYNTLSTGVNSIGRGSLFLTATCVYL